MFNTNLQILLVTFTIKVTTHLKQKKNITLSLAICIIQIGTNNKNNWLQDLKDHLLKGKHPEKITEYSFAKLFQPRKHESNDKNFINFTRNYDPNHQFSFN